MESKRKQIEQYLLKHKKITNWQSIILFRYTRLSDVIWRMRKEGYNIISVKNEKQSYVTYKLVE